MAGEAAVSERSSLVNMAMTPSTPCTVPDSDFQGLELLRTGHLNLPVQGEPAEWLLAVRRGDVLLDEWWNRALELDAELEALSDDESIPAGPNREVIEAWSVQTHLHHWDRSRRD